MSGIKKAFASIRNVFSVADIRKKILFTVFIIVLFRFGSQVPVPFVNPEVIGTGFDVGIMDFMNMLSGDAMSQATLFALGISPYITSSIVMQLLCVAIPSLERMSKDEEGKKTIQKITADTGCKIDINDDGMIYIASESIEACRAARQTIENIVFEPEVGQLYYGQVVRIIPIGAFIELAPGKDGMCHIKDLEFKRTEKVEDVLNVGDWTWVKVSEIDERGRVNLSRKEAIKERKEAGLPIDQK